ncbi:potassium channel family protein [Bacillus sp. ISL-45]|uniref:potassium channel family protein n=1 Tax=Bacillus sp. ISL-45 TaxID=2819128 RepID=UPI001BE57B45|nr:potassium channel family protein [Bacillus sp. ISL-45]MBT2659682.1 NAD-binding protein [Bacillus sp. ISL-45]
MATHLYLRFIRLPIILRIFFIAVGMICLFGTIIHLIEPKNFPTIFDGIWWAIITASTVGYGDYVPLTVAGRITAMALLFVGTGFLSSYFISLSAAAVTKQNEYAEGKAGYKGNGHVIIIGWNERSRSIISSISETKQPIILIDDSLKTNPLKYNHVQFIRGRANSDDTLLKANIHKAEKVIITSDQALDELHADMNTVLALLAIKGLNPDIYCIAEILTSEQANNARRAGADELIQTNTLTSAVILNSIFTEGHVNSLLDFLEELNGKHLSYIKAADNTIGKSFKEASTTLLSQHIILLGIKKGADVIVNPNDIVYIEPGDLLLAITN